MKMLKVLVFLSFVAGASVAVAGCGVKCGSEVMSNGDICSKCTGDRSTASHETCTLTGPRTCPAGCLISDPCIAPSGDGETSVITVGHWLIDDEGGQRMTNWSYTVSSAEIINIETEPSIRVEPEWVVVMGRNIDIVAFEFDVATVWLDRRNYLVIERSDTTWEEWRDVVEQEMR